MPVSAIITGDIVDSTLLPKPVFRKLLQQLQVCFSSHPHEFFRGDSFQVYVPAASDALPLLLEIRMLAMKLNTTQLRPASDIRASIGIAKVKQVPKAIGTATDEAFILSGRLFEQLRAPQRLTIASSKDDPGLNAALRVIAQFTDFILERMTAKQAEVIYELLQQKTQSQAARALKKTQVTVHKHAQAAGWPALEKLAKEYTDLTTTLKL